MNRLKFTDNADFDALKQELRTAPSIFISYGWDSREHKEWVADLADVLTRRGFYVVLDQHFDLEDETCPPFAKPHMAAAQILALGLACKAVIIVLSQRYMETCLLGKTGLDDRNCIYPSFVIPKAIGSSDHASALSSIFGLWKAMSDSGVHDGVSFSELKGRPACKQYLDSLPSSVRPFSDGWGGIDEFYNVILGRGRRGVSCILRTGNHFIPYFPTWDWRNCQDLEADLDRSLSPSNDNDRMLADSSLGAWQQAEAVLIVRPSDNGGKVLSAMVSPACDWEVYLSSGAAVIP